jgi:cardiolipin synthase
VWKGGTVLERWYIIYVAAEWAVRLILAPVVIVRQQRPSTTMAWLTVVMLIPLPAVALYFMFGETVMAKRRAKRYAAMHATSPGSDPATVLAPALTASQGAVATVAERLGGSAALGGNCVEFLADAVEFEKQLIAAIDGAKHHVHAVYFIFEDDEVGRRVASALERAAARGVKVRVLADAAGSWSLFDELADRMRRAGVDVRDHLPVNPLRRRLVRFDLRNHRKLAVIDGKEAFTGSHNIVSPHVGLSKRMVKRGAAWLDVTVRVRGPAVTSLACVFLDDWHYETGQNLKDTEYLPVAESAGGVAVQAVASGPGTGTAVMRDVMIEALHRARERVVITTPYFVPDESLLASLALASLRGVRVEIVVPHKSDKRVCDLVARSFFEQLLNAGVVIYRHQGGVLHSKTMTVDDEFALVGSANMDMRSFFLNFELGLLLYEADATALLRFCQQRYIDDSQTVNLGRLRGRSLVARLWEGTARLSAPLL